MALDFSFKSQFPIAQMVQAMQQKAVQEQNMAMAEQENKRANMNQLLTVLSQSASLARNIQGIGADKLAMQKAKLENEQMQKQMAAQQEQAANVQKLADYFNRPQQSAAVASPIQQFMPGKLAAPGMSDMEPLGPQMPPPIPSGKVSQPIFGQTAQFNPDTGSLTPNTEPNLQNQAKSLALKAFPTQSGSNLTEQLFPSKESQYKQFTYTGPDGGSYIGLLDSGTGKVIETGIGGQKQNVRTPKIITMPDGSKAETILDEKGNIAGLRSLTGPKMPSPEQAGKLAMLNQAISDVNEYEKSIINDKGEVNRKLLLEANVPFGGLPFTKGRTANSMIENAVQAKLRIETGAAATTDEVRRVAQRFRPSVGDNDETVKNKFKRLREYMSSTLDVADPSGQYRKSMNFNKKSASPINSDPLGLFP